LDKHPRSNTSGESVYPNHRLANDGQRAHFYGMQEYQAVILKLTRHTRDNEDTLTDLLNERSRGGWEPALMSQDSEQLVIFFRRSAET
jgi:hypothetical protein